MGGKAPQVRTGPKSLPAGRLGHEKTALPEGRVGRGNPQHQAQKKESRLIAESGLSKRGSYLLSHLV
ncbi:MAG: hypothetical protein MR588_01290 [Bacteroidales bacterium]|nr:hypothetical protein [Bacteroidales bacterium]